MGVGEIESIEEESYYKGVGSVGKHSQTASEDDEPGIPASCP